MSERRGAARQKSFLRGCIYFNNRRSAIDCLVRDISATGAHLTFSGEVSVPDRIELHIPQKQKVLQAQVQWRRSNEIGVDFAAGQGAGNMFDEDLAERVAKLELEIVALRKMLGRLKSDLMPGSDEAA
jgi:PilZ domain